MQYSSCRDSLTSVQILRHRCIQLATQHERPTVASAKVYVIGGVSDEDLPRDQPSTLQESIVWNRYQTLHTPFDVPDVAVLTASELDEQGLQDFIN